MMSGFKLSTSAFIYVRTATKTKPLSWTPNTRTTPTQHRRRYIPSHSISKNQILGFTRSHKLPCLGRAGLVTDLGSPVPSPQPQPQPQLQAQSKPEPEPEPSKLLTLPTILTLGRVAAVPLLVASGFRYRLPPFAYVYLITCVVTWRECDVFFVCSFLYGWLARNCCYYEYFRRCINHRLAWWLSCSQGTLYSFRANWIQTPPHSSVFSVSSYNQFISILLTIIILPCRWSWNLRSGHS